MQRGPKTKPRNVKVVEGSFRKDRDNPEQPTPKIAAPPVPRFLRGKERGIFRRIARLLAGMRVVSKADTDALVLYAVSRARWEKLAAEMRQEPDVIETPNGVKRINPKLQAMDKCQEQCYRLLAEFGLTPSARNRVTAL
jgi:P27 family predicted phage terminase small subunit